MTDVNKKSEEIITVNSSIDENPELNKDKASDFSNEEKEGLLREIQKERAKRQQIEQEKQKMSAPRPRTLAR